MVNKRVKKRIQIKLWKLVLFILLIIGVVYCFNNRGRIKEHFAKNSEKQTNIQQQPSEPEEVTTTASLVMVGDNLIHSSIYKDAKRIGNGVYDFKPIIEYIKAEVEQYDIAYYNQETILGGTELGVSDYPTFNSPQEVGDAMMDAGFNLVSLATNHTMDRGEKAALSSRTYWDAHKDVAVAVGSYSSNEQKAEMETTIYEVNGITYAMLNYTYGTNGMPVPSGKDYLVNVWPTNLNLNDPARDTKYQEYKETVKSDIEAIRSKVDVLIVAMHWGIEYTHTPTAYQVDSANFLAENNVDIVIGTHPHVIQPVTWIDDTLVFYSLGNFISAQYQNQNYNKMVGLMSSLTITKTVKGDDVKVSIGNVKNELIFTYYDANRWNNFKVIPFDNENIGNYLKNYKSVFETYKAVVQKMDASMEVVPAYE